MNDGSENNYQDEDQDKHDNFGNSRSIESES